MTVWRHVSSGWHSYPVLTIPTYSLWRCVHATSNSSSSAARYVLTIWFQLKPSTGFIRCEITNIKHVLPAFCLVFLCLEKCFLQFSHFCLLVVMSLNKYCFSSNKLVKTSSAFSLSAILISFSVLLFVFFFFEKGVWNNPFSFWTVFFWNSLFILFLPSLFSHEKISAKKKSSLVFFSPFFVSLFLSTFSFFLSSLFSLMIYPFIFVFRPLFAFLSFFSSLLLHSFFISLSQCFSFSFFSTSCFHICFSPSPFLRISFFWCKTFFFSPFWSWSLCFHTSSSPFFLHLHFCFLLALKNKVPNFLWSIFLKTKMFFFFFEPSRYLNFSRVFSSLRRHFSLFVQCFLFFSRFFIISYLDFLLPIFFLGLFQKSFCFRKKSKNHWFFSQNYSFWKTLFPDLNHFSLSNCLPCMIFKKHFAICLCFQTLFEKYLLYPFFLLKKKPLLKSNWFSVLFLFPSSSSCFVLSLCVFSLCSLS